MSLTVQEIVALLASAQPSTGADYDILTPGIEARRALLARSKNGAASLLIPVARVGSDVTRLTHGLAIRGAAEVEFARGATRWTGAAAVVECREPRLMSAFAGLVAAVVARVEAGTNATWESVSSLFAEWERLLARRAILSGESELGLWAELWWIVRSIRGVDLIEGWRGPDAERVDFLLDAFGFEIKAGRRPGVHIVSQDQVDAPLGEAHGLLVSMHVMPDPLRGRSLEELVAEAASRASHVAQFEEKLAATGYSRADEEAYHRRYVVLEPPRFYDVADVPRVRAADPGVTNIRFRVELDTNKALSGSRLTSATAVLGIDTTALEYPCA